MLAAINSMRKVKCIGGNKEYPELFVGCIYHAVRVEQDIVVLEEHPNQSFPTKYFDEIR